MPDMDRVLPPIERPYIAQGMDDAPNAAPCTKCGRVRTFNRTRVCRSCRHFDKE